MSEEPPVSPKPQDSQAQIRTLLAEFITRAEDGLLANIAIAFTTRTGVADVYSSPMSPVSMNHLLKLFDRRVNQAYDRALRAVDKSKAPASPTGSVKTNSPAAQAAALLPRKVRRQVLAAAKRANKKNGKKVTGQPSVVAAAPGKTQ